MILETISLLAVGSAAGFIAGLAFSRRTIRRELDAVVISADRRNGILDEALVEMWKSPDLEEAMRRVDALKVHIAGRVSCTQS